ncbi:MAG: acyl-ACP--UDP-N-acetylglucosamine O-acyltransferase [Phycisphaerae bacterium]|nr:acyl-ACP--UDP-N-acetylglucosamine O-acyltransferase [Phycisphaerae bacterium]
MPQIHPTATVIGDCTLADDVQIGPYCSIRGPVTLEAGVRLLGHVYVQGPATIGAGTVVYPFACLGFEPQDYKFKPGAPTAGIVIGRDCLIRESATVHASTKPDRPTRVGDRVFMMVNTHVAHDCLIGSGVVMVNGSGVAGHAELGDNVTLGGNAVIHQFCRVGRLVMMSGDCAVSLDVPPFCMVNERNRLGGLNLVGMRRNGVPRDQITELRKAFRDVLRRPMPRSRMVRMLEKRGASCPVIAEVAEFVKSSKRGVAPGFGKPPREVMTWLQRQGRHDAVEQPAG